MRSMTRVAAIALACLMFTAPAWSGSIYRGSQLYSICESANDTDRATCGGYVAGVFSTLADPGMSKLPLCPPDGANVMQMVLITQKFMRENPTILNSGAAAVVALALREAFVCSS